MSGKDARDAELDRWERTTLAEALQRLPERRESFRTASGIELLRLYTSEAARAYLRALGFPGQPPFTRGVHPTMYRGRLWTMRQYAGFGTAEATNQRFRYLLDHGQTGLSVAFDLPTQMGYDSDHPLASGEVGRAGVAIASLEDMRALLAGIPLDRVSTSMTINATAPILLALYLAVADEQGVPHEALTGTLQNDILKEYIARGCYIYPPGPSLRLVTDVFEFGHREVPRFNTISISGYHIREAGSTAVQEVAFTLADGIAYVEAAVRRGLGVDAFASRLSFFFNVHNQFLEEIAKFRAARRLWGRIMAERFGAKDERSCMLRFHAQTAGSTLTAQQPEGNLVRVALQALAAALGGCQSLHTNAYDEALALPTEHSARLALRTQQVIAHESEVTNVVDPVGGAYAVEALTEAIEAGARQYLEAIEARGGMVAAIEQGYPQREIQESAYRDQQAVERRERVVVGVNAYQEEAGAPPPLHALDPELARQQRARLARLRAERRADEVAAALEGLRQAAGGRDNLMPFLLRAVKARATLGEISDVLREVFGTYRPPAVV
ncbi:MAG: methylmalonyl-CoA mutase [Deltaproteobacteria bacterium]|nr:methylmalonyl-CoA mutase [Deltaproteobacteria bacterium]